MYYITQLVLFPHLLVTYSFQVITPDGRLTVFLVLIYYCWPSLQMVINCRLRLVLIRLVP